MGFTINPLGPPFDFTGSGGGGGGTPGGNNTQVQFNDAGSFGGAAGLVYDKTVGHIAIKDATVDSGTIVTIYQDAFDGSLNGINVGSDINPSSDDADEVKALQAVASSSGEHALGVMLAVSARSVHFSTGTLTTMRALSARNEYGGGVVSEGVLLYLDQPSTAGGSAPIAHYGIKIQNQTIASAATNYAVDINSKFRIAADGSCILLPAGGADGDFTGTAIDGTAGTSLTFGDLIYLAVADSRWELTDADSVTTCGSVLTGMCVLAAAGDGSATRVLLQGVVRADAKFPALTIGAPVYASTSPGLIQVAAPSGTDDIVQVVGYAMTADEIYFNPSSTYLTVA